MNYGTVNFKGKEYSMTAFAEPTNRLLEETPNYNNKDENGGYLFEMSAPALDDERNEVMVYWIFYDKNEGEELDSYDYDQVDRVESAE